MNNRKKIAAIIIALMVIALTAGCVNRNTSEAGNREIATNNTSPTSTSTLNKTEGITNIVDILANPDAYLGKIVTIKGRPSGNLSDRTNNKTYPLVYTVEEISLNKSRFIDVITYMYPKERLECIREISVTGQVQYENRSDSGEANKVIIVEQSRKVLYIFDAC